MDPLSCGRCSQVAMTLDHVFCVFATPKEDIEDIWSTSKRADASKETCRVF